jgi:hypothetical protein
MGTFNSHESWIVVIHRWLLVISIMEQHEYQLASNNQSKS